LPLQAVVGACLAVGAITAGLDASAAGPEPADDPVWREMDVPAPPAFSTSQLVDIDMGPNVALKFGIDPKAVAIGTDGVIRYVVVASSAAGVSTGLYEGIRCSTGEVKTYARFNEGKWELTRSPEWRSLFNNMAYRHSLALAKQGACDNSSPPRTVSEMVRTMKNPRSELAH
jgi:hypothetical protein